MMSASCLRGTGLRAIVLLALVTSLCTVPGTSAAKPSPSETATAQAGPPADAGMTRQRPRRVRIAAAGDIACAPPYSVSRTKCRHAGTADLIRRRGARAVLPLGDTQYDNGSASAYRGSYDPTWGTLKGKTYPVPGNHEYYSEDAAGYYGYFGDRAHGPLGYYAYDLGRWRLYALNSQCDKIDCAAQVSWLRRDLDQHPRRCSLAYMHEPRFSSGMHGASEYAEQLWPVLDTRQVDVVLAGHDHDYERFAKLGHRGRPAREGIRSFVVGTGGKELRGFRDPQPGSRVRRDDAAGVLFMVLRPRGYSWYWRTVANRVRDSGTARCVR